jgi:hypothetical protein
MAGIFFIASAGSLFYDMAYSQHEHGNYKKTDKHSRQIHKKTSLNNSELNNQVAIINILWQPSLSERQHHVSA